MPPWFIDMEKTGFFEFLVFLPWGWLPQNLSVSLISEKSRTHAEGCGAFYWSHPNGNFTIIANQSPVLLLHSQKKLRGTNLLTNKHPIGQNGYLCMEVAPRPKKIFSNP